MFKRKDINYHSQNYHYWENGKRKRILGVTITIPEKYKKLLTDGTIQVNLIDESFAVNEK